MIQERKSRKICRRNIVKAAIAAGGAAVLGFPNIIKAQGVTSMRWQSTWPSKDIFHEFALDFAKKVNDMTGGDLKIEVLPAGAVVPAFQLLEAVQGHAGWRPWRAGLPLRQEQRARAVGLGPGVRHGREHGARPGTTTAAARSCSTRSTSRIGANVVSFPYGPMPTQPLGWFKKPVTKARRLQGPEVPHRGHLDRRVHGHGRRGERAARRRDRAGDGPRPDRGGGVQQRVLGPRPRLPGRRPRSACCRATTRTREQFEILFNKTKFDALPEKMKAIIAYAVDAASADMSWKAIDRYSKDYIELQTKDKVSVLQDAGFGAAGAARDLGPGRGEEVGRNPMFKEVARLADAPSPQRAVKWDIDNNVDRAHGLQPLLRQAGRQDLRPRLRKKRPALGDRRRTAGHPSAPANGSPIHLSR